MPDFNAKMHQNRFQLGLGPRHRWGSLQRSPDPLVGFKWPTSKGRGGRGARPVCLLVLTILATGLGWEVGRGQGGEEGGGGREGRGRAGWVGGLLCEILNTPLH